MTDIKSIYIFRHGETDWNKEGRMQGGTDIPLNAKGRAQALKLREFFAKNPIDVMLSSDLGRALETARIAMGEKPVPLIVDPRLRETNLGDAEGLIHDEVISRFGEELIEQWRMVHPTHHSVRFPNGESKAEHLARLLEALSENLKSMPHSKIGVSTHGGSIRRIVHHLLPHLDAPTMVGNCVTYRMKFDVKRQLFTIDESPIHSDP